MLMWPHRVGGEGACDDDSVLNAVGLRSSTVHGAYGEQAQGDAKSAYHDLILSTGCDLAGPSLR